MQLLIFEMAKRIERVVVLQDRVELKMRTRVSSSRVKMRPWRPWMGQRSMCR